MKKLFSPLYIWTSKILFMLEMKCVFSFVLFLFSFTSSMACRSCELVKCTIVSLSFGLFYWMLEPRLLYILTSLVWFSGYQTSFQKGLKYLWSILCLQQVCRGSCLSFFCHAHSLTLSLLNWFSCVRVSSIFYTHTHLNFD